METLEDLDMRRRGHKKKRTNYRITSKTTQISVRIPNEFIPKLSENKSHAVSAALELFFKSDSQHANKSMEDLEQAEYEVMKTNVKELVGSLEFMFEFFESNKMNLDIDESQKAKLKRILMRMSTMVVD